MIALVRIDDRLVHGQVVEGWLPFLGAARILVISDRAAVDSTQFALMRLALPEEVRLDISTMSESVKAFRAARDSDESVLVLAPGPGEILALVEGGVELGEVNVGGLHFAAGRVQLGRAIYLSPSDVRSMKTLSSKGVRLVGKAVPTDKPLDVAALLEESGSSS